MTLRRPVRCICAMVLFGCSISCARQPQDEMILYNGHVITMDPELPEVEAVAISKGKIVAVGALNDTRSAVRSGARIVDLRGKYLLPGLIDSHCHAIEGGERLLTADLDDGLVSAKELTAFAIEALRSGRGVRGDGLYITGVHSSMWSRIAILDSLFRAGPFEDMPVMLVGSDGHTAWCNSVLLHRAGINAQYIDALPGEEKEYYGLDQRGRPTGFLTEDAIQKAAVVLPQGIASPHEAALQGVRYLNGLGITAWLDPSAGEIEEGIRNEKLTAYRQLAEEHKLTAHVATTVVANPNEEVQPQIDTLKKLKLTFGGDPHLVVLGFKVFADGVLEYPTQTAAVSIPYSNSGKYGSLMLYPRTFPAFVTAADRQGLLVHVHAIGDRAVTETLNAFEAARKTNGFTSIPHTITHLQIVTPGDISRFADLGVLASMQLLWAIADRYTVDLVKPYIDSMLYVQQYPARSLSDGGATVCGASDWPVTSANPFEAMAVAETREGPLGILNAREAMDRSDMLRAYTVNAARALMMGREIGSVEIGKYADLVLVDRDVKKVSSDSLRSTRVLWTMLEGSIVYGQEGSEVDR